MLLKVNRVYLFLFSIFFFSLLMNSVSADDTDISAILILSQNSSGIDKTFVACKEPHPQICTQDYRPVCGQLKDGSFKTYSNGCSACSDKNVKGYRDGACEDKN